MDYLMGIDLGSTSLKAVVYDLDGNAVCGGIVPNAKTHPNSEHPEWTVWLPEAIWKGTADAVRMALADLENPRQIRGVAVTGMGMDGLPVDETGNWLYPFISWHDPRTGPQLAWWRKHVGVERTFTIAGNPVWPINSALRILWMQENEPEIMARADKWLLIEDYVNFLLCGRQVTDYSMASCTMLFDQRRLDWSEELLDLAGIERRLLCMVQPSGTILGEVTAKAAAATGLAPGTPVVLAGHDHLCGALPVGAFRPGRVLDVTGTWESVLTATNGPVLYAGLCAIGTTVQAHVARGKHAVWGGNVAAEMLEWYRRQFGFTAQVQATSQAVSDWEVLMASASSAPPGSHGVMFLPHMVGASCPVVDPKSLGAFVGLSGACTSADVLRAIVEGLDYQFRDIVTGMEAALGTRLERFAAVGGATQNAFWMQNKADVLGRPIEVPNVHEATPLGAAILAGIGLGLYRDEEDALRRVHRPGKTYEPDAALASRYAEWFADYKELHPALAPDHHRLFDHFRA
jgi:xylulokinase